MYTHQKIKLSTYCQNNVNSESSLSTQCTYQISPQIQNGSFVGRALMTLGTQRDYDVPNSIKTKLLKS